jgi:hypothetical protein
LPIIFCDIDGTMKKQNIISHHEAMLTHSTYSFFHRSDNQIQQLNVGFSSLTFPSTMSSGIIHKPDLTMPHSISNGGNFVAHKELSPHCPTQLSPVFGQYNKQQLPWHQSSGNDSLGSTPRNSFAESSFSHSSHSFSSNSNTHLSLDKRSSHFPTAKSQQDELTSLLPPPIQLDASDEIGRFDNSFHFLSENGNQPQSPFSPRNHGSIINEAGMTRERSFSSPGTYFQQQSYGTKSPLPSSAGQILYEDEPLSWNGGSGLPAPSNHIETNTSSPCHYDRFSSRPPRHGSITKDTQALLSPRIDMRHGLSDGNFNLPSGMPVASMSPIANNNHGRFQSPASVAGSSSFDSSIQGGRLKDLHPSESMDTL